MKMVKNHVNVVVIGSGPAGYSAAFRCADLGFSTLIIEKYTVLGGTCLNVGCIPSKSLLHLAKVINEVKEFNDFNINLFEKKNVNLKNIKIWKEKIIHNLSNGLSNLAKQKNVNFLSGIAKFINKNTIAIMQNNIIIQEIEFDYAIIATGSQPFRLKIFPYEDHRIWTSTEALQINSIPKKLLIVGSGIIGLEMATIYKSLGSNIDFIDSSDVFFPSLDDDISIKLFNIFKNFYQFFLSSEIIRVDSTSSGILVNFKTKEGKILENIYDNVIVAVGRIPKLNDLNLENLDIKINSMGFINVDQQLRTNVSNIFAIGDVTGQPMLAHKGIHQAFIAAEVISGKSHYFDPMVIPNVAYCDPEIAWVGLSESLAKYNKINFRVVSIPWIFSGRAVASNCSNIGITKLIINSDNNKIIGGCIVGKNAGDLISQISLSIEMGCDIEDLSLIIHPHPTFSETLGLAAQHYLGISIDVPKNL